MWENYYPEELYHHGVKGMKWGVRRFQNKDGSLTAEGRKRYGDGESASSPTIAKKSTNKNTSGHQSTLVKKYIQNGMTKAEAEKAAKRRINTERVLLAASAMTVAAAGIYIANKRLKGKCDSIIRAGSKLQRIEMQDTGGKLYDVFYAAKERGDKLTYAGVLGKTRQLQTGQAFLMEIGVDSNIKVAGRDKAAAVFKKLYETDTDFNKHVAINGLASHNVHYGNYAENGQWKKMYENFNSNLIRRDDSSVKKFYEALRKEGYGAVQDINDRKFSGYNAKNPLIIFDGGNKVSVKSSRQMSDKEIDSKYKGAIAQAVGELLLPKLAGAAAIGGTAKAASMVADDYIENNKSENKKTKKQR